MCNSIYHSGHAPLNTTGETALKGGASISLFTDGQVVLSVTAVNRSISNTLHIDADSLRLFAKLLNDAVEALPTKVEEAA